MASVDGGSIDDMDGDGLLDLIFHFRIQETNLKAAYGASLAAADAIEDGRLDPNVSTHQSVSVTLTGQEFDGVDIVHVFLEGKPLRDFLATLAGI